MTGYRDLQASGMAELDRLRSQSTASKWLVYDHAEAWVRRVLPDLEAFNVPVAVELAVRAKRAGVPVTAGGVLDAVVRYRQRFPL